MIIISYYTKNTAYEEIMTTRLLPTLRKWKLLYDIKAIEDKGNWQKNTHYKAEFIKKMLIKHKQPVVFLDCDATIERIPALFYKKFLSEYDLCFHELDWFKFWRGVDGGRKFEALSGTLWLNYNETVLTFLEEWIEENRISTNWEQRNMQNILKKWKRKLKVYPLPIRYIAIIKQNGKVPDYIKDPVIIHWQASRKHKK